MFIAMHYRWRVNDYEDKLFQAHFRGLILGLSFAGMFVMSSATAQAQQNDDWWNRNRRDNRSNRTAIDAMIELNRIAIGKSS